MKKQEKFLSGAQAFISELEARGIAPTTRTSIECCPECGGAGMDCWCDRGIVEYLVVEWEE